MNAQNRQDRQNTQRTGSLKRTRAALLALSTILPILLPATPAHADSFTQPLHNDPVVRRMLDRKIYEPGGKLFPFKEKYRGTTEHRTGRIGIIPRAAPSLPLGGGAEIQQLYYGGTISFRTRFENHPWEEHRPFDDTAVLSKIGKGAGIGSGSSPTSYAYRVDGIKVHPADGYDPPQGGGFPTPSPYGAHDRYSISVSGTAQRMVQNPLDLAFGAKAALTSLQGTAERTVESYNEAKKNLNDSYRADPARSITDDIHEYARARIANIQGAVQFATLPVGIATDTVTGLVGATTESNDYSRQYRQNQETIAAMHSMDAATLFKSIGNLTERQEQNNREAADKAAFWRDFGQSLNQKAQQNPISASAMDIAARTVGLRFGAGAAAAGMGRTATEGMVRNGFGSFGSGSFAHAAEAMAAKRAAAETKAKVAAEAEALKRIGANQSARKAENAALSKRQPGEFAARQAQKDRVGVEAKKLRDIGRNNRNPEWFAQQRALNRQAAKDAAKADIPNKTMKHIVDGEMRGKAARGGHSTTTGRVRVDKVVKENPNGTYEAKISIYDPKTKRYVPKTGNDSVSTMFPDHWSKDRIKVESDGAFRNRTPLEGKEINGWEGTSPSGIKIEGFIGPNNKPTNAYPGKNKKVSP